MAKDTEKLIRQLSLISFLMANRRPVSALEIKREVEGYSSMNEDAFARRFYADRAELESLGISLQVDKPAEGFFEAELYALPPENYYLPAIEFTDAELAALRTALGLLDGEFAYAEPLRLALQQVSWGRPSPLTEEDEAPIDVKLSTAGRGRELSQRLAKIETAISRRKTIEFSYYSLQRDETSDRKVNPYHLVFRDGPVLFDRLLARARRGPRLPPLADPRQGLLRDQGRARLHRRRRTSTAATTPRAPTGRWARSRARAQGLPARADRLAGRARLRQVRRRSASRRKADGVKGRGMVFETEYASARQLISWVLCWRENARLLDPPELAAEADERLALLRDRHRDGVRGGQDGRRPARRGATAPHGGRAARTARSESVIRPERFARLVTLAGLADRRRARRGQPADRRRSLGELNISLDELREDLDVLNVVNFGGGTYVLYAEIVGDEIEVDPDTYGDNFARPARLLPLEAKALVAAIDLFGDHLPQAGPADARARRSSPRSATTPPRRGSRSPRAATTRTVVRTVNDAIQRHRVLELQYYKENEDEFVKREVEPYQLVNGPGGLVPRLLRPRPRRHPPLPPRPDEGGDDHRRASSSPARASRSGSPSRSGSSTAR